MLPILSILGLAGLGALVSGCGGEEESGHHFSHEEEHVKPRKFVLPPASTVPPVVILPPAPPETTSSIQVLKNCGEPEGGWKEGKGYLLEHDIYMRNEDNDECFIINTSNVGFDCQNHTIFATRIDTKGISVADVQWVTIRNCKVEYFDVGISVERSSGVFLDSNIVADSRSHGIVIQDSGAITLERNMVYDNSQNGIDLESESREFYSPHYVLNNNIGCGNKGVDVYCGAGIAVRREELEGQQNAFGSSAYCPTYLEYNSDHCKFFMQRNNP